MKSAWRSRRWTRGHLLFINKGCIVCHAVNGVGGDVGPALNASDMPSPMNVFEFAARMWKGAPAMVAMQQEELGDVIQLTGQNLADIIAFVHDGEMQKTVAIDQVPKRWKKSWRGEVSLLTLDRGDSNQRP